MSEATRTPEKQQSARERTELFVRDIMESVFKQQIADAEVQRIATKIVRELNLELYFQ